MSNALISRYELKQKFTIKLLNQQKNKNKNGGMFLQWMHFFGVWMGDFPRLCEMLQHTHESHRINAITN